VKVSARNQIAFFLGVLATLSGGAACAREGEEREDMNMEAKSPVVLTVYSDYV